MSEDFKSGRLGFNLQVKLSRNMTLNTVTDYGSSLACWDCHTNKGLLSVGLRQI